MAGAATYSRGHKELFPRPIGAFEQIAVSLVFGSSRAKIRLRVSRAAHARSVSKAHARPGPVLICLDPHSPAMSSCIPRKVVRGDGRPTGPTAGLPWRKLKVLGKFTLLSKMILDSSPKEV